MTEIIKFSSENKQLFGTGHGTAETGSEALFSAPIYYVLGTEKIGGTITGALRQFNLPTSRAPGDWPEPYRHTVRY